MEPNMCPTPKRACPMEGANAVEVMSALARIEEKQTNTNSRLVDAQTENARRLKRLEDTVGRMSMVSGLISATVAGFTMGIGWLVAQSKVLK